ncbi:MAG: M20 family metallopeptidase [Candidatus Omnitrophota bacterium]
MIKGERLTRLTQKVLSFNSENPPGNEYALSRFIERDMRSLGLKTRTHSYAPRRPNVVAILPGSLPRKKAAAGSLMISPHFDTVPVGQGWKYDPFGKDIVRGRLYGRGASDDKGNTAVAMEVMRSLVEDGVRLKHDLIMAATVDEETGSHYGIVPLLDKKAVKPGYAVVLDSDDYLAVIAQKGLIHCRVQIRGKKAHGAYNWRGRNAIETAARCIAQLKAHKFPYIKHPILRHPTANIGTIQGGDKVNMVADFCEFSLDLRFLPGTSSRDVLKDVREILSRETRDFKICIDDIQKPYEISPEHPFVASYLDEARRMRVRAGTKGSEGATVMTFFQKYRIPAFATGFGTEKTAHSTDEYARLSTLIKGARLLESYIKRFDQERS